MAKSVQDIGDARQLKNGRSAVYMLSQVFGCPLFPGKLRIVFVAAGQDVMCQSDGALVLVFGQADLAQLFSARQR